MNRINKVTTPSEENVDFEEVYLSRGQLMWRAFRKNRLAMVGMWILIVMYIAMIFADFWHRTIHLPKI